MFSLKINPNPKKECQEILVFSGLNKATNTALTPSPRHDADIMLYYNTTITD